MDVDDEYYGYDGDEFVNDRNGMTDGEDADEHDTSNIDNYRGDSTISVLNPKSVKERIDETLEILSDLKSRTNMKISRSQLLETLSKDLSEYYGYLPELSEFLLELFSPAECVEYMDASDRPRPLVIRTNTLKTTRKDLMEALNKRGVITEVVDWSKVAIKITESSIPIGATPEYLGGHYMLQSAASMNPVLALAPQPNERVLDMAAAPGGKTSYVAQLMKNSGVIIANDLKPQRQKATAANLHRLGVKNAIVCCHDGRKFCKVMKGFDRVLLDAPCSGLGVISRDPSVKIQRTVKDIQRIAHLQKELLVAAVDAVDHKSATGGIIVYSTCSISVEENEAVVDYILSKRHVRLIETGLTVGKPGLTRYQQKRFHASLSLTRRFYPHVHNMDGFFVAKLQKYEHGAKASTSNDDEEEEDVDEEYDGEEEEEEIPAVDDCMDMVESQPVTSTSSSSSKSSSKKASKKQSDIEHHQPSSSSSSSTSSAKITKKKDDTTEHHQPSPKVVAVEKITKKDAVDADEHHQPSTSSKKTKRSTHHDDNVEVIPTLVPVDDDGRVMKQLKSSKSIKHQHDDAEEASEHVPVIEESIISSGAGMKKKAGKRLSIREMRMMKVKHTSS